MESADSSPLSEGLQFFIPSLLLAHSKVLHGDTFGFKITPEIDYGITINGINMVEEFGIDF